MQEILTPTLRPKRSRWRWTIAVRLSRQRKDRIAEQLMRWLTLVTVLLVPLIALALLLRARPILVTKPLAELLLSTAWHPLKGEFGFYPFITGTLWVTAAAMVIAVPPSLLTAIYLAEYASGPIRSIAKPLIDLLAGIPSVVYGIWGILTVVPFVERYILPACNRWLAFIPLFQTKNPTGYGVLAGGLVLAVMVFPVIIAVADEVIRAAPQGLREASLALGATRWQTVKHVILRHSLPGVIAAVVLGFSRAFGETMAVLMVVGNVAQTPHSIFDAAYPLPALIANNYGEMMSIPLYDAALLGAALILLIVVLGFNVISRLILMRLTRRD
jgi:phosphate transport system permease protein